MAGTRRLVRMPLPRPLFVRSLSRPVRMNSSNDAPDSAPRMPPVTLVGSFGSSNGSSFTPSAFNVSSACWSFFFQSSCRFGLEGRREIADAQLADVEVRVVVERQIEDAQVLLVGLCDG